MTIEPEKYKCDYSDCKHYESIEDHKITGVCSLDPGINHVGCFEFIEESTDENNNA
jgi:hypothetical protein